MSRYGQLVPAKCVLVTRLADTVTQPTCLATSTTTCQQGLICRRRRTPLFGRCCRANLGTNYPIPLLHTVLVPTHYYTDGSGANSVTVTPPLCQPLTHTTRHLGRASESLFSLLVHFGQLPVSHCATTMRCVRANIDCVTKTYRHHTLTLIPLSHYQTIHSSHVINHHCLTLHLIIPLLHRLPLLPTI